MQISGHTILSGGTLCAFSYRKKKHFNKLSSKNNPFISPFYYRRYEYGVHKTFSRQIIVKTERVIKRSYFFLLCLNQRKLLCTFIFNGHSAIINV